MHIVSKDLAEDYAFILQRTRDMGAIVAPRGKPTREILAFTLELTDPTRALVRGTERKVVTALAAAEALQLVGGFSDPGAMLRVSEHFGQFMDGGVFHAPYGPRIATQLPKAVARLQEDPSTRKAHVSVWDPTQDMWDDETRDHPCTTHMQFMVRREMVDLHVGMRANDAWRGFPYDVFQFCQLQLAVANALDLPPGTYYHHVTSFHLYEENVDMVGGLTSCSQTPIEGVGANWSKQYDAVNRWTEIRNLARRLFYGGIDRDQPSDVLHGGELLMYEALRKRGVEGSW